LPGTAGVVTSFAPDGSDGLLSFKEIFDLKLDADVVILSACDTAGSATAAVSREAGIATGGNYALDGLVRAFVERERDRSSPVTGRCPNNMMRPSGWSAG
jgi:CHAT domain-containing protein